MGNLLSSNTSNTSSNTPSHISNDIMRDTSHDLYHLYDDIPNDILDNIQNDIPNNIPNDIKYMQHKKLLINTHNTHNTHITHNTHKKLANNNNHKNECLHNYNCKCDNETYYIKLNIREIKIDIDKLNDKCCNLAVLIHNLEQLTYDKFQYLEVMNASIQSIQKTLDNINERNDIMTRDIDMLINNDKILYNSVYTPQQYDV